MRRSPILLTLLLAGSLLAQSGSAVDAGSNQPYIVLFADSAVSSTADGAASIAAGRQARPHVNGRRVAARVAELRRHDRISPSRVYSHAVGGFAARLSPAQVKRLAADPSVATIMRDAVVRLDDEAAADEMTAATEKSSSTQPCVAPYVPAPGSPCIPAGVRRVGATQNAIAGIDGADGPDERVDIDIGILDTGIDAGHPDLNVVGGYNCTSETNLNDGNGHGTHVAGTVAAIDNGSGVVGVAPGARLWRVKVLNRNGSGYVSGIICGIDWVTAQRDPLDDSRPLIEVANMSLRFQPSNQSEDAVFHQVISASVAAGTVYAVAAGNESNNARIYIPAAYPEVIAVGATVDYDGVPGGLAGSQPYTFCTADGDDRYAKFSSYGAVVDIAAPGKCVLSSWPRSKCSSSATNCYAWLSGTSMATPHVTGGAALYLAQYPGARPQQVRMALQYAGRLDWKSGSYPATSSPPRQMLVGNFAPPPDFSANIGKPSAGWLSTGRSLSVPVTVSRTNGHSAPVGLALSGTPNGVQATGVVSGSSGSVGITVKAGTPGGTYAAILSASDGELVRASRNMTLKVDTELPTASFSSPASALTVQSSSEVSIAWSESDAVSGIAGRTLQRQRAAIKTPGSCSGVSFSNIGVPVTGTGPVSQDLKSGYCFRWRLTVRDIAGNSTTITSGRVLIDTTAPPAPAVSLAGAQTAALSGGGIDLAPAFQASASKVWFRGGVDGSIDLRISGRDPQSGIVSSAVGAASPGAGWGSWADSLTGNSQTVRLPFNRYAVSSSVAVRSTNGAGLTGPATSVALRRDATAPSPASWATPKSGTSRAGTSFQLSWSGGSDSGSGLSPRHWVRRLVAPANSAGTCKGVSYRADGSPRMLASGANETALQPGNCYRWRLRTTDNVGNLMTRSVLSGIVLSGDSAPATVSAPSVELKPGAKVTPRGLVRVVVSWSASAPSGVTSHQLRYSANGGSSWTKLDSRSTPSQVLKLPAGSYLVSTRSLDASATWSKWGSSARFTIGLSQAEWAAAAYKGNWTKKAIYKTLNGKVRKSKQRGASASYAFTGRAVALVGLRKPKRGKAAIYLDGTRVATIDTRWGRTDKRRVVFSRSWAKPGKHVLEVRVLGTAGRPRVDLDAFIVLGGP